MTTTEAEITTPELVEKPPLSRLNVILKKCISFPALLAMVLVVMNFEFVKLLRLDPDTWWHIKYGDAILRTGHWPTVDAWSFTVHGMPRVAYEWGGEVLIALAYRLGGFQGMDVLLIVLTSVIVLLLFYFVWMRCENSKAAFLGTLFMLPVAVLCFTLRPQLLGYIFLLITLICLERFRQGKQKSLWLLPPLFLVWVNTHGSFTLGFFVIGIYWLSGLVEFSSGGLHSFRWTLDQRIHLELVTLLSVIVLPLTPYGTRLATIPLNVAASLPLNFANIQEWQQLNMTFWESKLLLLLLLALIAALVAFRPSYRLEELALFLLVSYLTFIHIRFAILYAILFAPLAASILARWVPSYDPNADKPIVNLVLILAAIIVCLHSFPKEKRLGENIAKSYPVQAVQYLQQHRIPGHMFNDYGFGGYLVWALAPEQKVFIDGRGDVYEEAGVFSAYMDVVQLKPDVLSVLQSYQIDSCLIQQDSALATMLSVSPGWKRIYTDKLSTLYVRVPLSTVPGDPATEEKNRAR